MVTKVVSLEQCEKWCIERGYDPRGMAEVLHAFSKSTVGHSWVDQSFRAEEERQKGGANLASDWKDFAAKAHVD